MKKISGQSIFIGIVVVMVIAVVAVGLYLAGSPNTERLRRFDEARSQNLMQIAGQIDTFYIEKNQVPDSLDVLVLQSGGKPYGDIHAQKDPRTGVPYEYRVIDKSNYEVCAVFDQVSYGQTQGGDGYPPSMPYPASIVNDQIFPWKHGIGRVCFAQNAEARTISQPSCGLRNPCQAGQTCAAWTGHDSAVCVPAGKECLAAGCAGACALSESYPVQVSCKELPR